MRVSILRNSAFSVVLSVLRFPQTISITTSSRTMTSLAFEYVDFGGETEIAFLRDPLEYFPHNLRAKSLLFPRSRSLRHVYSFFASLPPRRHRNGRAVDSAMNNDFHLDSASTVRKFFSQIKEAFFAPSRLNRFETFPRHFSHSEAADPFLSLASCPPSSASTTATTTTTKQQQQQQLHRKFAAARVPLLRLKSPSCGRKRYGLSCCRLLFPLGKMIRRWRKK